MYGFVCKILLNSVGFFRCFKVNFNFQKKSVEVSLVYFLSLVLISLGWFLAFRHFYSSSTINSTPWFVLKNIAFGPRSRHRKIPPAAVTNQIAGKARIPPAHE